MRSTLKAHADLPLLSGNDGTVYISNSRKAKAVAGFFEPDFTEIKSTVRAVPSDVFDQERASVWPENEDGEFWYRLEMY